MLRNHPVGILTHKKCDRRNAGGNHATADARGIFVRCRMRREPAPAHHSGEAKTIEGLRVVVCYSPAKDLPLPRIRRRLIALQLLQYLQGSALPEHLTAWR